MRNTPKCTRQAPWLRLHSSGEPLIEFKGLKMYHCILRLNNKSEDLFLGEQRSLFPMSVCICAKDQDAVIPFL